MLFNVGKKGGTKVNMLFENESIDSDVFKYLSENGLFNGIYGEIYVSSFENIIFLGLGKEDELTYEKLREIFFKLAKKLISNKISEIELYVPKYNNLSIKKTAAAISEGMMHAEYKFDNFKTDKKNSFEVIVNYTPEKKIEKAGQGIDESIILIDSIFMARDLVNLPSNYIYPETLAQKAIDELTPLGVKVTVYDKKQIEDMKMDAFLSVAKGSDREPRFIVMEYKNNSTSDNTIGFVGKGITYDSGGYSIKPANSMSTMFDDMAGAATVISAMKAIAKKNIEVNIIAVIAACENLISGYAYKPGDIIGSMSGKTIEVDNTDCEGRLTLADALYYITSEKKVDKVIDLATLTGGVLVALGELYTGAVTNDSSFLKDVKKAATVSGEKIWQLPCDPLISDLNKSEIADIKNMGGRFASTASAAMFLKEFIGETSWVHLDIAGTAYLSSSYSYLSEGATGILVKTLYHLAKNYEKK